MTAEKEFKVFISVDMEGISGVIDWKDVDQEQKGDYEYFRKIMTQEVNAAIEGCLEAGAGEITVRDAHGSALNLLPLELNQEARLIRQWADSPLGMMEGIDASYQATVFIGYHAKAGTRNAVLKHTFTSRFHDVRINRHSLSEASFNALIAGTLGVPLICLSGDRAICDHIREFIPGIETAAVKEGIQKSALHLHPVKAQAMIRSAARTACLKRERIRPLQMDPPFRMELRFSHENLAAKAAWFPKTRRLDDYTIAFRSNHFEDCLAMLFFVDQ